MLTESPLIQVQEAESEIVALDGACIPGEKVAIPASVLACKLFPTRVAVPPERPLESTTFSIDRTQRTETAEIVLPLLSTSATLSERVGGYASFAVEGRMYIWGREMVSAVHATETIDVAKGKKRVGSLRDVSPIAVHFIERSPGIPGPFSTLKGKMSTIPLEDVYVSENPNAIMPRVSFRIPLTSQMLLLSLETKDPNASSNVMDSNGAAIGTDPTMTRAFTATEPVPKDVK